MSEIIRVKMADLAVGASPKVLITTGLGSCVGVAIYDSRIKLGGLAHIMLPGTGKKGTVKPFKYSHSALDYLLDEMYSRGAVTSRLKAKLVGGAQMFNLQGSSDLLQIGKRNVEAVKDYLLEKNIPVIAEDVGGSHARTMELHTSDGKVLVKSFKKGKKVL